MIKRKENWQECLNKTVEAARVRSFSWGEHDCCVFSASCVEAITGIDHMASFHGAYNDEESAKNTLKTKGAKTLFRTLQKFFGASVHPAFAQRGDLVYRREGGIPAVGVCLGEFSAFVGVNEATDGTIEADGLVMVKTVSCIKAFRV